MIRKNTTKTFETSKNFMINHFNEIGWLDPDQKQLENFDFTNLSIDGYVYEKSKYNPIYPPYLIYIPNNTVLKKMF